MLKFDKFCELILNEDVGEDLEDLSEEPISNEPESDLIDTPVDNELENIPSNEFSSTDSLETRIEKIKTAFPTMSDKNIEKLAKNDVLYTTWVADAIEVLKDVQADLNSPTLDPLTPDLESDLPEESDIEDIKTGLEDYEGQKDLESEDSESMLDNDQNI